MKILLLTTDAYGNNGGIALYNQDLIEALAAMPEVTKITVVPRNYTPVAMRTGAKIDFQSGAAKGKLHFALHTFLSTLKSYDLILCGHINLIPLAGMLASLKRLPLVLLVYGIDVWKRPRPGIDKWLKKTHAIWSISEITKKRMLTWSELSETKFTILPNAIHLERYSSAPANPALQNRYTLRGHKVLFTLGRLSSYERYKGVDEVLEALPALLQREPRLKYLIGGDGDDKARLEKKVRDLGLNDYVVFSGFIPETEKADHYRLADVYVMPGTGEGFGFVFLEALACGVPAVGSLVDGSREALRDGELGWVVDPVDSRAVQEAILKALETPRRILPGLHYFAWPAFQERIQNAARQVVQD